MDASSSSFTLLRTISRCPNTAAARIIHTPITPTKTQKTTQPAEVELEVELALGAGVVMLAVGEPSGTTAANLVKCDVAHCSVAFWFGRCSKVVCELGSSSHALLPGL